MTYWKIALGLILVFGIAAGAFFFFVSPPRQLDLIDGMMANEGESACVAEGVRFGDQPRQQLDVWAPKNAAGKKLPVLIFYYGGSWRWGSRSDYGFVGRAFAARGYVVVIPDYRLVPQVRFPAFVEDSALAVKWTRDHIADFGGDPARIAVAGHSAGAYNAAMVALDAHYLQAIGVDPKIIRAGLLLAGPFDFYPFDGPATTAAFGAWPRPAETQPVSFARADAPPLLIMQGTADDVVKPRNAPALAARLKAAGAVFEQRDYAGANHNDPIMGLSKPFRSNASTLADSLAFLQKHDH